MAANLTRIEPAGNSFPRRGGTGRTPECGRPGHSRFRTRWAAWITCLPGVGQSKS